MCGEAEAENLQPSRVGTGGSRVRPRDEPGGDGVPSPGGRMGKIGMGQTMCLQRSKWNFLFRENYFSFVIIMLVCLIALEIQRFYSVLYCMVHKFF